MRKRFPPYYAICEMDLPGGGLYMFNVADMTPEATIAKANRRIDEQADARPR